MKLNKIKKFLSTKILLFTEIHKKRQKTYERKKEVKTYKYLSQRMMVIIPMFLKDINKAIIIIFLPLT